MTIIEKRTKQIQEKYQSLSDLEDIFAKLGYDYGIITDEFIEQMRINRNKKIEIKGNLGNVAMAVFNREYELTDEYLIIKSCKYQLKAIERLMSGLRVRIESLRAESKGQY